MSVGRRVAGAALASLLAQSLGAQTASPTPAPKPAATPGKTKAAKPPLDFSGVWELDAAASRGVSTHMQGAVLRVRQTGNKIWIEPIDQKEPFLLSEQVVVDGRAYEKAVGAAKKGTLTADWGKDGKSVWLQVVAGTPDDPVGVQRMVWRLQDGGRVWTRQSWTIQADGKKETFLVFRKQ